MRCRSRATWRTGSASSTRARSSSRGRRKRSSAHRVRSGRSSSSSGSWPRGGCRSPGYRSGMVQDPHRLDVTLEPLDEYLVIQPTSDETETRAGLILPASAAAAAACRTGIVTAIGADVTGIEPGDKVLYPREAGYEVRLGGIEVKVVKRDELIARIHD